MTTASAATVKVVLADGCRGDVACSKYNGAPPVPVTTFEAAAGEANLAVARQPAQAVRTVHRRGQINPSGREGADLENERFFKHQRTVAGHRLGRVA